MEATIAKPKINAIVPWYGGNRMLAENVGAAIDGSNWVGIPFAGGMAEIAHIKARTVLVNDLHWDVVNLAKVVADAPLLAKLQRKLSARLLHPGELYRAQLCILRTPAADKPSINRAANYFTIAWMTRSGTAGTDGESKGKLCIRWEAGGGDSAKRWQSAIESLPHWFEHFKRCTFSTLDCFDFLAKCKDAPRHAIYCDPPFPGPGGKYTHRFDTEQLRLLAEKLRTFEHARIVCRFYDHPVIRKLFPIELFDGGDWRWNYFAGRTQANKEAPEVLLIRN